MAKLPKSVARSIEERMLPDGRRAIKLKSKEKAILRQENQIETAVAMFLDLDHDYTWADIAQALGVSVVTLKKITKGEQFIEKYNEHFADLGHDPRLKASQAALVDMLPKAIRELGNIISDTSVSPTVRLGAIKEVIRLNGVEPQKGALSDNAEFAQFLKNSNVEVSNNTINVSVPEEYRHAITSYVEGDYKEIPTLDTGSSSRDPSEPE